MLCRFFKTGAGEYGYGDRFIGLKCPQTRMVVKEARLKVSLPEIHHLLLSPWHEARLCGLLLLVEEMQAALPTCRRQNTPEFREYAPESLHYRNRRQRCRKDILDGGQPTASREQVKLA